MLGIAPRLVRGIAGLVLAAAFAFFGYFKTVAPLSVLAEHHAWTVALPEWLGRIIGISELAAAATLLAGAILPSMRRAASIAAGSLIVNQACAATVHLASGDVAALPQNAVLVAFCAAHLLASRWGPRNTVQPKERME